MPLNSYMSSNPTPNAPMNNASSGMNGIYAITAINTLSSVMGSLYGVEAFKTQVNAQANANILNMKNATSSYQYSYIKNIEQIDMMNGQFADKMSENGLSAMKDEARLRAASAETGTYGGTTELSVKDAYMKEASNAGYINSQQKSTNRQLMDNIGAQKISLLNTLNSLGQQQYQVNNNPLISALSGGLGVAGQTISMLPDSYKAKLFNYNTQGVGSQLSRVTQ